MTAFEAKKSRYAITSGSLEPVSDGPAGLGSPFANTLVKVLEANENPEISFLDICSRTVQSFSGDKAQTPKTSSIEHTGHDGGSFIFRLAHVNTANKSFPYRTTRLPVKLRQEIPFEDQCFVPFFYDIGTYDWMHLNHLVHSLAFKAIKEAKEYYNLEIEEKGRPISSPGYALEISPSIHFASSGLISLSINVFHIFGGAYPHRASFPLTYSSALNDALLLEEIVDTNDFGSIEMFVSRMLSEYAREEEQLEIILRCTNELEHYSRGYYLTEDFLVLDFTNDLPHAVQAIGCVEIPKSAIKMQV